MGICLAAGGLLSAAADQRRHAATSAFLVNKSTSELVESEREANQIAKGASYFLLAFLPALLGLFGCIGFDAIFEIPEVKPPDQLLPGLLNLLHGGYQDELMEVVTNGAFLGGTLFMMLLGFISAKSAFVISEEEIQTE